MEEIINGLKQIKTRVDSGTITTVNGTETLLSKQLAKMIESAINYTHSCTELKEKETISFEEWLKVNDKQYIYDDFVEGAFTYSMGSWYREYLKYVK